jgi:Rieske [2Fe-2S] domain
MSAGDILTQIGPGTPIGTLMRQYWMPALLSSELKSDGAPVRLKLLGENLIAFRDTAGRVGILDHICPHRCASLFFGRNRHPKPDIGGPGDTFGRHPRARDMAREQSWCGCSCAGRSGKTFSGQSSALK